jgi:hypothetical protein
MALFADIDDSYTKTGKGTLTRWANRLTAIPVVGGWLAFPLGMISTTVESLQYLFRGQFGSALTAFTAGTVSNTVNGLTSSFDLPGIGKTIGWTWWLGNAASGIGTGATLGTHARALTETVIGGVTGALGVKPKVLSSYTAGMGSLPGAMAPQGPGRYFSEAARSRGEDPDAAYARLRSGNAEHIAALEAARAQQTGTNYRGA